MYDIEDIKCCVQEWFADSTDPVEVALTYHEIVKAAENQLNFMMGIRFNEKDE